MSPKRNFPLRETQKELLRVLRAGDPHFTNSPTGSVGALGYLGMSISDVMRLSPKKLKHLARATVRESMMRMVERGIVEVVKVTERSVMYRLTVFGKTIATGDKE